MGGWEEEEREEAMIGFLKVETRHRHFSFDQMIASSGASERACELLRRVTSSADRASEPRIWGIHGSTLVTAPPCSYSCSRFALMFALILYAYVVTYALSSASATSTSDTLTTLALGSNGKI